MKKLIVLLTSFSSLFVFSCTSISYPTTGQSQNNINQTDLSRLDREDYFVGGNVETQIVWTKTGPLFFLFGSNGGNEEIRREKVYLKACKENHIDGIVQPKFETKRFVLPLLVWNYSQHKTYVTGKGYRIKTDSQKKLDSKSK